MRPTDPGMSFWAEMGRRGPDTVVVGGVSLGAGSRVRLRPRSRGDVFDLALDGRVAIVEGVEEDDAGALHLAVTLEDDPGRDLGELRLPGHRFFFAPEDVEPLGAGQGSPPACRVLVAGIGNVFLGDDGFGVEVVRRLGRRPATPGVDVVDFGIRGMDLAYALQRDYDAAIFVDAAERGEPPGTLSVIEPGLAGDAGAAVETHGMDPVRVLRLARELGRVPERTLVVACEPATLGGEEPEDVLVALSGPVGAAVDEAVGLVESLVAELTGRRRGAGADGAGTTATAGDRETET